MEKDTQADDKISAFISYSRTDEGFTRRLVESLKSNNKDPRCDRDFVGGNNWRELIRDSIENSDYFVFIVTIDSLKSAMCHKEIEMAREYSKRIIPIMRYSGDINKEIESLRTHWETVSAINPLWLEEKVQDTVAVENWKILADLQWIYIRKKNTPDCQGVSMSLDDTSTRNTEPSDNRCDADSFDDGIQELITALDENYKIIKEHSSYLRRSLTWENNERHADYLLKQRELEDAEWWLQNAPSKYFQPTSTQTTFILASRDNVNTRLRRRLQYTLIGATIFSAFLIGFLVVLLILLTDVEIARRDAQANYEESRSLYWANRALQALSDEQTDLAIALALESLDTINSDAVPPPPQAYQVMIETFYAPGFMDQVRVPDSDLSQTIQAVDMHISPEKSQLVLADNQGNILLWNLTDGERELLFATSHEGLINTVVFSPNGQMIASGGADNQFFIWDTNTGDVLYEDNSTHPAPITALSFSHDGRYFVVGDSIGNITFWDAETFTIYQELRGHTQAINDIAFSPDDNLVATASNDTEIGLWATEEGVQVNRLQGHVGWVMTLAWLDDNSILSGSEDHTLFQWDINNQLAPRRYFGHQDTIESLDIDQTGTRAISVSRDGAIILWDLATTNIEQRFNGAVGGHEQPLRFVAFTSDWNTVLTVSIDNNIAEWFVGDRSNIAYLNQPHNSTVDSIHLPLDNRYILTAAIGDVVLREILPDGGDEVVIQFEPDDRPFEATINDSGNYVLMGTRRGGISLWEADVASQTGTMIREFGADLEVHSSIITSLMFNADSTLALSADNDGIVAVWDVATGELIAQLMGHESSVLEALFLPDSDHVLSIDVSGQLIEWDIDTQTPVSQVSLIPSDTEIEIRAFAIHPNGDFIAIANSINQIELFTLTGEFIGQLVGHPATIWDIAINENGLMASASSDGTVILWNVIEQWMLYQYHINEIGITSIALAELEDHGEILIAGGVNGDISLWHIPNLDVVERAIRIRVDDSRARICRNYNTIYELPSCQ